MTIQLSCPWSWILSSRIICLSIYLFLESALSVSYKKQSVVVAIALNFFLRAWKDTSPEEEKIFANCLWSTYCIVCLKFCQEGSYYVKCFYDKKAKGQKETLGGRYGCYLIVVMASQVHKSVQTHQIGNHTLNMYSFLYISCTSIKLFLKRKFFLWNHMGVLCKWNSYLL